jgi:cyclase
MRLPLLALVAILSLVGCDAAYSQEQGSPKGKFTVHRVPGNVYMLDFDGDSNVAVLVGSDGLVLVDAEIEPRHQMIVAALKQLSDKPVRYLINTHCHGDHTSGNAAFQREGATVIAHRNVRERLATQSDCAPRPVTGLPTVTFDSELTLYVDDEEIHIIKLPMGHTDGDAMVYFKKANVVETGDAFVSRGLGGATGLPDSTMMGFIDEQRKIVGLVPEDAKVIPGHGSQASIGDVRRSLQTLEGMRDAIERQVRAGKRLEEIRTMNVLSPWNAAFGEPCKPHADCDHLESDWYLKMFYKELTTSRADRK